MGRGFLDGEFWSVTERQFFNAHICASMCSLVPFSLWILSADSLNLGMAITLSWLLGLPLAALLLLKSKSLEHAFLLSAFTLAGLITTISAFTGGIQSFAVAWLLIVPMEATFIKQKRSIVNALIVVLVAISFLLLGTQQNWFSGYDVIAADTTLGFILGPLSLILYISILTFRVQQARKISEDKLQLSEERYQLLSNNTRDLVTQHTLDGKVLYASNASVTLLGKAPQEICGAGFYYLIHASDRPIYENLLSDVLAKGLPLKAEFRVCTVPDDTQSTTRCASKAESRDVGFSWVEMHCRPVWKSAQNLAGITATICDITEHRFRQDELQLAHQELQQLSDIKSRFLANVSHELRTPLNSIIGFSEILQREPLGTLKSGKYLEYVGHIQESGNHLLKVVTDILDVSKIESGSFNIIPEVFDVKEMITSCTGIMSQHAESSGVSLVSLVPENLPTFIADPRACRQILLNLLSNAIKFSDKDDKVVVSVRVHGDQLAFIIQDEGIGIGAADLKRVGQPFFQADTTIERRYEGTGLGVSVVKGLAELHKGHVKFESELGKGTSVTVFIPLVCESSAITNYPHSSPFSKHDLSQAEPLIKEKTLQSA